MSSMNTLRRNEKHLVKCECGCACIARVLPTYDARALCSECENYHIESIEDPDGRIVGYQYIK